MSRPITPLVVALFLGVSTCVAAQDDTADFHLKVATAALSERNFVIALDELKKAERLEPNNALVRFNIATVLNAQGHAAESLVELRSAMTLGLSDAYRRSADDLLASLTYKVVRDAPISELRKISGHYEGAKNEKLKGGFRYTNSLTIAPDGRSVFQCSFSKSGGVGFLGADYHHLDIYTVTFNISVTQISPLRFAASTPHATLSQHESSTTNYKPDTPMDGSYTIGGTLERVSIEPDSVYFQIAFDNKSTCSGSFTVAKKTPYSGR